MKRFEYSYTSTANEAQLSLINEGTLLFDIETTGLSAKNSSIYCIGYAFYREGELKLAQLFAEAPEEEKQLLSAFLELLSGFHTLLSYNGRTFDVRYLQEKCKSYGLDPALLDMPHLDLYRLYTPYKKLLGTKDMKQKSLEQRLDTDRKDLYGGGELIQIYQEYVKHPEEEKEEILLLHNREDVYGLFLLTKLHALVALFSASYQLTRFETEEGERPVLALYLSLEEELPLSLSYYTDGIFLYARKKSAVVKIPFYQGKMRYYYDNYKDYYYFPEEDMAIHKMVAKFAASTHKEKASAKTAYTWQKGRFLPFYDAVKEERDAPKLFYKDQSKKEPYILYDDSSFASFAMAYCKSVFNHILAC